MATAATSRVAQETTCPPPLCLAFALGVPTWQRGGPTGAAPRPRARHVPAGDGPAVRAERRRAPRRVGGPAKARGGSGAAAGRDGGGLQRCCVSQGRAPAGVAAASRAVPRRARRAKTERLAVPKRRPRLRRPTAGAPTGWRVVRGPRGAEADRRPRHRARLRPKRERSRGLHRRTGLLAGGGMRLGWHGAGETPREVGRPWEGAPRPAAVGARRPRGVPGQRGGWRRAAREQPGAGWGASGRGAV